MARQEMLYQGQLSIDGAEPVYGEIWYSAGTAVLYLRPSNQIGGIMRDAVIGNPDPSMRLTVTGVVDGSPTEWVALTPEKVSATYRDTKVRLADGREVTGLVTATNHKVTVAAGGEQFELAGARVRTLGGRAAVIEQPAGDQLTMTLPKRGCGCNGSRS